MTLGASRVLVLGATGMLGHELVRVLADEFAVHAAVREPERARRAEIPAELHPFDAKAADYLPRLLERSGADAVVNCIGIVKQRAEALQPIPSITINSLFPHELARACVDHGVRVIHLSTDCVFSGSLLPPARYTEEDTPDPTDLYGRSKLLGEIMEAPALTLRTSIIGWELDRPVGLLEWLVANAGQTVRGFARGQFSGLTTRELSRVILELIRDFPNLHGLYHVASSPISKYDLLRALNEALRLECTIERVEEPRVNRALDPSRFSAATGIEIPSWATMISGYASESEHAPQLG